MKYKKFIQGSVFGVFIAVAIMFLSFKFGFMFHLSETPEIQNKINMIYNTLDKRYVDKVDKNNMIEGIYRGMVGSIGDVYTTYLDKDEYQYFLENSKGFFNGIGLEINVNQDKNLVIVGIMKNSPSYNSGIHKGDIIVKVDGESVQGLTINDVVKDIKGEKGTHVTITVFRPEENKEYDFDIIRNEIKIETIEKKVIDKDIGYIRIKKFGKDTYDDFVAAYKELDGLQKGLIIDLRDNPGGLFDSSSKIADFLLPKGLIVYTVDKDGKREDTFSDEKCINVPFCLLVNENSASASEILAGAVSDTKAGKLIGTKTYGKGLVQGLFDLKDGTALKITIQKYYTPKGVCIQGKGIIPDYEINAESGTEFGSEDDRQLNKAIEVIRNQM